MGRRWAAGRDKGTDCSVCEMKQDEASPERPPVVNRIQKIPFDHHCVEQVADAIGGTWAIAPFGVPGGDVFQITVPDKTGKPAAMLTLWPPLKRIDAISAAATIVFTDIVTVELVGEVEVQFRRSNRDLLVVARGGKLIVRA